MEIFREENRDTWRSGCFTMYVHKNVRLALDWQEKKVELCRHLYEEDKNSESALKDYENAIRELGSLLMKEGYAKQAKQQFRKADQLAEQA